MDLEISEEHRRLKETVAKFCAKEVHPLAEEIDLDDKWPSEIWMKMAELGIMGVTVDEKYGGAERISCQLFL